ncbi:MAG: NAD(P)/FAD-dependent oxidoreductase [Rhabdochlamydiaceae bacterium]|nr:NAD(P)/FAD-dependent oxidoreductase [Rhabdochlamydiaceae bacterium]
MRLLFILIVGFFLQSSKDIPIKTRLPEENKVYPIAIVGAGAAGTMAVNRAVLDNREVLLFTGAKPEQKRSSGRWVKQVDNVPGLEKYKRPILELRNEVLEKLFQGPFSHNLYVIEDSVTTITKQEGVFKLQDRSGRTYLAKYVALATGIMQEQPHIQGSIRSILDYANGQTICYCCLCDGHRSFGKKTAVIGFKEVAANIALTLQEKYQPISMTILTNGHPAEFSPELLAELKKYHIPILEAPIQEIIGNKELKQLSGFKLETGAVIDADISFVALGIRPNNQLALQLGAKLYENGLVVTDSNGESSVPNLFAIGDLQGGSYRQIYTAWQHAADAIQAIDDRLIDPLEM